MKKLIKRILVEYDSDKELIHGPRQGDEYPEDPSLDIKYDDSLKTINGEVRQGINEYLTTTFAQKFNSYELNITKNAMSETGFVYEVSIKDSHSNDNVEVFYTYSSSYEYIYVLISYNLIGFGEDDFEDHYLPESYSKALSDIGHNLAYKSKLSSVVEAIWDVPIYDLKYFRVQPRDIAHQRLEYGFTFQFYVSSVKLKYTYSDAGQILEFNPGDTGSRKMTFGFEDNANLLSYLRRTLYELLNS